MEALAIRVKQSIFRTTCQIHHQGLVFKKVISPAMPRLGPSWECVAYPKCTIAHAHTVARTDWLGLRLRRGRLHCCVLGQCRHRCPARRVRCQHPKIAMPVRARRWHQGRNALYQLQRREMQLVDSSGKMKATPLMRVSFLSTESDSTPRSAATI